MLFACMAMRAYTGADLLKSRSRLSNELDGGLYI